MHMCVCVCMYVMCAQMYEYLRLPIYTQQRQWFSQSNRFLFWSRYLSVLRTKVQVEADVVASLRCCFVSTVVAVVG